MPLILVSVSHDANSVISGIIPFFFGQDDQMRCNVIFCHVIPLPSALCDANALINDCICLVKIIKMRCNTKTIWLASHDANVIKNCTNAFLRSRQLTQGATSLFWPLTPLALQFVSCDANSVVNGTIAYLRSHMLHPL